MAVVLLTAAYAPDARQEQKVIRIASDLWCPVNCTPLSEQEGIGIELVRKIFEAKGYTVDYLLMPWARAIEEARAGKLDAVVGVAPEEGQGLVLPKHGIADITDDFYVAKDDTWRFDGIPSLEGKRLGTIKDYGYDAQVLKYIDTVRTAPGIIQETEGGDALEQNIRKLVAHKVDVVIESGPVMNYMLRRLGMKDKLVWAGGFGASPVYIGFSAGMQESAGRARIFDEGMEQLKASGALPPLYEKYGFKPPEN